MQKMSEHLFVCRWATQPLSYSCCENSHAGSRNFEINHIPLIVASLCLLGNFDVFPRGTKTMLVKCCDLEWLVYEYHSSAFNFDVLGTLKKVPVCLFSYIFRLREVCKDKKVVQQISEGTFGVLLPFITIVDRFAFSFSTLLRNSLFKIGMTGEIATTWFQGNYYPEPYCCRRSSVEHTERQTGTQDNSCELLDVLFLISISRFPKMA